MKKCLETIIGEERALMQEMKRDESNGTETRLQTRCKKGRRMKNGMKANERKPKTDYVEIDDDM